jgi:hypothetical protein
MSNFYPISPKDRTEWLFAIGQRLRVEYNDVIGPLPPRLAVLLKLFEASAPVLPSAESQLQTGGPAWESHAVAPWASESATGISVSHP